MGLFEQAVETYDHHADRVGIYYAGEREPLAPVGHILAKAGATVILDKHGKFMSAISPDKEDIKTIIPATDESAGRTGTKPRPHPLCEQLEFLTPKNEAKWKAYSTALDRWRCSKYTHPFLDAVYYYVQSGHIEKDLQGILSSNEKDRTKNEKLFIRWSILGIEEQEPDCWKNPDLFLAFQQYYQMLRENENAVFCQVSGSSAIPAKQHLKGIAAINGNAKLISSNDTSGFTYRGRFTNADQALTIGYEASQKAHNALKWLIANQGVIMGGRTFLCWNPQGKQLPSVRNSLLAAEKTVSSKPSDYRKRLKAVLLSIRKDQQLKGTDKAIIAVFDAATSGRLAVIYYKEMAVEEYLERLRRWDEICSWWYLGFGIQAPALFQLVNCASGALRKEKGVWKWHTDDRLMKQQLQRLLSCRMDGGVFPADICKNLIDRASYPQSFEEKFKWREVVYAACCAVRMIKYQKERDDCMTWELDKPDRSFQFGRLLAAMERVEEQYYYQTEKNQEQKEKEQRQTNAIRRLSAFKQRPLSVYEQVNAVLLNAYLPRVGKAVRTQYDKTKEEIISRICALGEENLDSPLSSHYLIGYDLQRKTYFTENKKEKEEETENGSIEK